MGYLIPIIFIQDKYKGLIKVSIKHLLQMSACLQGL